MPHVATRYARRRVEQDDAIGLVKALGFIAWADQRIAPEEREMLETVMGALEIPEGRRRELCTSLGRGPESLDQIAASFTDDVEKRFAVAQAIFLARADGDFAAIERTRIRELAQALDIDDAELAMIYAAVDVTGDLTRAPDA
jgi:tellurite resistance protein